MSQDCVAAEPLLWLLPARVNIVQGDKGDDSNAVRSRIEAMGAAPNTPPKSNCQYKPVFLPARDRGHNAVERMFGRLKHFRRIATRYDRWADVFLAAIVSYWFGYEAGA